jgi:hypothetical protein
MALGLTDHVWTIGELIEKALANVPDTLGRRRKPTQLTVIDGGLDALVEGTAPMASPKCRKGSDSWSGWGSQPAFIKEHLAAGGSLEDLRA